MRAQLLAALAFLYMPVSAQSVGAVFCSPAETNSTGEAASLQASGSDLAGGHPLTLTASGLPKKQFAYFLVSQTQAFIPSPAGSQGTLCLGGNIGRYANLAQSSGESGQVSLDVDTFAIPVLPGVAVQAGETWSFQLWYRDRNPDLTSNFTSGCAVTFGEEVPLEVNFGANSQLGSAPFSVSFTDLSTGSANAWFWDFGDGSTSTEQHPVHEYTERGSYDVRLVVNASENEERTAYIQVVQGFGDVWADFNKPALDANGNPSGNTCIDCHGVNGFAGLDMPDEATAHAELVAITSACDSATPRVAPGDLEHSLLYTKLAGQHGCGLRMPLGQGYPGDLDLIATWILEGALP